MSYLYGVRFAMEENDLILSLREVRFHYLPLFCSPLKVGLGNIPPRLLFNPLALPTKQHCSHRSLFPAQRPVRRPQRHLGDV